MQVPRRHKSGSQGSLSSFPPVSKGSASLLGLSQQSIPKQSLLLKPAVMSCVGYLKSTEAVVTVKHGSEFSSGPGTNYHHNQCRAPCKAHIPVCASSAGHSCSEAACATEPSLQEQLCASVLCKTHQVRHVKVTLTTRSVP